MSNHIMSKFHGHRSSSDQFSISWSSSVGQQTRTLQDEKCDSKVASISLASVPYKAPSFIVKVEVEGCGHWRHVLMQTWSCGVKMLSLSIASNTHHA